MYNLTVDTAHTYYVGEGQWLVHNCGPTLANGAKLDFLTQGQIDRIQAYVDKTGATVTLFGSKASGASYTTGQAVNEFSDFDYIISGVTSRVRADARDVRSGISLPRGRAGGEVWNGVESGMDIWTPESFAQNGYTLADRPHIVFTPKSK